jgi:hypothetical protein
MHYIPVATLPPQTTAIFRDFKKSTAMCKVHNVGLRYIKYTQSISLQVILNKVVVPLTQ